MTKFTITIDDQIEYMRGEVETVEIMANKRLVSHPHKIPEEIQKGLATARAIFHLLIEIKHPRADDHGRPREELGEPMP